MVLLFFANGRGVGIAADADFILVCAYEENGEDSELAIFKTGTEGHDFSPGK